VNIVYIICKLKSKKVQKGFIVINNNDIMLLVEDFDGASERMFPNLMPHFRMVKAFPIEVTESMWNKLLKYDVRIRMQNVGY
jgi:hypothetical protein